MRQVLRIIKWAGLGVSTLLLVGATVFWVRSIEIGEDRHFHRFEANPHWNNLPGRPAGTTRHLVISTAYGRLWLNSFTVVDRGTAQGEAKWGVWYECGKIFPDQANKYFDETFLPGERPWRGGVERAWRFAGVGFRRYHSSAIPDYGVPEQEGFGLAIPFWMLTILSGAWPGIALACLLLRKKRYAAGLCQHCGYDLRATPERCPECGNVPEGGSQKTETRGPSC